MAEVEATGKPECLPSATHVHIEFENGLKFDRDGMEVDALIVFFTNMQPRVFLKLMEGGVTVRKRTAPKTHFWTTGERVILRGKSGFGLAEKINFGKGKEALG